MGRLHVPPSIHTSIYFSISGQIEHTAWVSSTLHMKIPPALQFDQKVMKITFKNMLLFSVLLSLSVVSNSMTPRTAAHQASLSITNSWSPRKPTSIESVMPFNHVILCHPLLLLPSVFPSIRIFSNESALCIRWPKYWSFSFNISPSNEHSGLISLRMDWLDLLTVQWTIESSPTPQFKTINSSVLSFLYSPTLTSIHDC